MRRVFLSLILLLGFQAFILNAQSSDEILITPNPATVDDNLQVTINGFLPTPCDYVEQVKWEVERSTINIFINIERPPTICAQVLTPYTYELSLDKLPVGRYRVQLIDYKTNVRRAKTELEVSKGCVDPDLIDPNPICIEIYDPVCGCDGITYDNECYAEAAGLANWTKGKCNETCIDPDQVDPNPICPEIYDPVCGCDGITYDNECFAEAAGLKNWTKGECGKTCIDPDQVDPNPICPEIYDPVCGCDGETYSNECFAEAAGLTSWTKGKCAKACVDTTQIDPNPICPEIYDPVCGCDDTTYDNECYAEAAGLTSWTKGKCEEKCIDPDKINPGGACPRIYLPVCGCDGKTYSNTCEAEKAGVTNWTEGECNKSCGEDRFEPNDKIARYLRPNKDQQGLICPVGDNDWFFVFNRWNKPNVKVTLTNLPDDYDLFLFDKRGQLLDYSIQAGNDDEAVIFNSESGFDFFFVYVKGYKAAYNAALPYTIRMEYAATPYTKAKSAARMKSNVLSQVLSDVTAMPEKEFSDHPTTLLAAPNPFENQTTLRFNLPKEGNVSLTILDVQGRVVRRLIDQEFRQAGSYQEVFDRNELKPGIYFSVLSTALDRSVQKLIIMQ